MIKFSVITVLVCAVFISASAQQKVKTIEEQRQAEGNTKQTARFGESNIKCYYEFTRSGASSSSRRDTLVLETGPEKSRFYDPSRQYRDSMVRASMNIPNTETIKSISVFRSENGKDLSTMQGTVSSRADEGESYQIFKDLNTGKIKVVDYTSVNGKSFEYEDQVGPMDWKIQQIPDTIINSYSCKQARLNFRGREYTAWFSPEVPINDGPWKFMGLPGLIVKVEDSLQLFSFSLIGLEQTKIPVPIQIPAGSIKCSRADFEKMKAKQPSGMQVNFSFGNLILAEFPGEINYVPMELK
ncbi:GLPGLI family protein [Pedobacter antarcticus]|uniref:GLPGLI family protein n=1 Tax=Pedobacter antarcticus TaxID=34086 RepID=UPI00292F99D7|nr:GLPGLI family protein [Pedobacter antarcticus]